MTPMQQQYHDIKKNYPDDIVLFRLGDFYESFDEDAKTLNKEIGLTLTGRGKGENRIPMAGIPHHALDNYLPEIITAGYKVVIVDQLSDPEPGKTLVERGVTKIYTAGTLTDEHTLKDSENNYLAALCGNGKLFGLAYIDVSTGKMMGYETDDLQSIYRELNRIAASEVVIADDGDVEKFMKLISSGVTLRDKNEFIYERGYQQLLGQFETKNLRGFGIEENQQLIRAAGALLFYLEDTQRTDLRHLNKIQKYNYSDYMQLDIQAIQNLELLYPIIGNNKKATVYNMLDDAQTAMGRRKLRDWLLHPYVVTEPLQARWDSVDYLLNNFTINHEIRDSLSTIADIERILGRVGVGSSNARELNALLDGLTQITTVISKYSSLESLPERLRFILTTAAEANEIEAAINLITENIEPDPPISIMEGKIIKSSANEEVAKLRKLASGGKEELAQIQARESERTGITSLKIGFNKVFGYYIEVTRTHSDKVPDDYIRKQTLANAERYITPELKELEETILSAQEKLMQIEYDLFVEIRNQVAKLAPRLLEVIDLVAELDVLSNFAYLSREFKFSKPTLAENNQDELVIKDGRHLVVERLQEEFTANDVSFDQNSRLVILTGPNMSGKSTYIRQVALITLLAQIGCFVPAAELKFSLVDRIFTRVGAADNLSRGESTFMVEMTETANILNNATDRSLVILDEVGRGTSTYDGVAIAWAICEHILEEVGAKTLFATHYHELISIAENNPKAQNLHVEVVEDGDKVLFKHKISPGATSKSYGVHVAEMAGVPKSVVTRANQILNEFEHSDPADTLSANHKVKQQQSASPKRPKKIHPEQLGLLAN